MEATIVVFLFLAVLIALGIDIPLTLGMATFFAVLTLASPMDVGSLVQGASTILPNSVTLIAIPLFALTGSLIANSVIGQNLITVSNILVGRVRGGLAIVNIIASFLFGGISGSASADTASIGGVLIPMMVKSGYDKDFSVVVTITSSCLGPIVPPSIIMIVFGWLTNTSIAGLFVAGYLPGLLLTVTLSAITIVYSIKRNYPVTDSVGFRNSIILLMKNLPVALMPLLIIVGIVFGILSPTEAGAFGVLYSIILLIGYRQIKEVDFNKVLVEVVTMTGISSFLLAFAFVFSRFLTFTKAPIYVTEAILPYISNQYIFLLVVVSIFLLLGCLMNPVAAITMTLPILFPISQEFGISPFHLGMVATVSLAIGHVTPPVGISLFIGASIAKMRIEEVLPMLLPFLGVMVLTCVMLIFFPEISLFLPRMFGFM
jgi:C4-dicarboxylate transporter DctM subunit